MSTLHRIRPAAAIAILSSLLIVNGTEARKKKIDGTNLWYSVEGRGRPTVVFDSGLGDSHDVWRWVAPKVAKETRVFLYDRAGLGRSDPGLAPRSPERMVGELRRLLEAAKVDPPYVLVGHSLGGLNARLFASRYPEDVAGMVLVDAMPARFPSEFLKSGASREKMETVLAAAPHGVRLEYEAVISAADRIEIDGTVPEIPVAVLSSRRPEESEEFRERWLALQKQMAAGLDVDIDRVVDDAGHYLQYDAPDIVVESILTIVEKARNPDP